MRCQRLLLFLSAIASVTLWTYACGDGTTEPDPYFPEPTTITVSPATAELVALDATVQLSAEVKDQNGQVMAGATVTWASSATAVATVDASGLVTSVANGTATITATAGEASGSATVTVAQVVSAVAVAPDSATVLEGDTLRLAATATDANGHVVTAAEFVWASVDTLVAVVDTSGLVTGVGAGLVQVTATAAEITGRGELTVVAPVPTTVAVTPDTLVLIALGHTAQLTAEVRDQAGRAMDGVSVAWSSADTSVAVVDTSGLVAAVGSGAATVTATAGEAAGEARVNVRQSAGSVTVSPSMDSVALGDTLQLVAEAYDETGHVVEGAVFTWSSSDAPVATVDPSGLVRGAGEGTATITATAGDASGTSEITVVNPDRAALVALYNATDGPNWVDNTNWLTDAPLGEWYGVSTDAVGRVVRINLAGRYDYEAREYVLHGLRGELPAELANLTNLTSLNLSINDLSGPIPPELGDLSNLWDLSLLSNALSGPIPPELGGLSNLRVLRLERNALSGPIPPELGGLSNLWILRLRDNNLTGAISPELGGLSNLRELWLERNGLSGPIPPELGGLSNLRELYIHGNALSGPIPPELGGLSNLERLWLNRNDLTGEIPPELGGLSNLERLWLNRNDLSGPIPPELGGLSNLEWLDLAANDLSGAIPQSFLQLRRIERFIIVGQDICVPGVSAFVTWFEGLRDRTEAWCNAVDVAALTSLYELAAGSEWAESGGWLGGPALEEWHGVEADSLGRVTALGLSDNGLSGSLPGAIADLGQLASLRIDGNELGGRLPLSLTVLDLDEFHYDGTELCEPADARFRDWLDGIPSRRGTAVQCAPLTDRDALVALYESTGGPGWTNSNGWLTEAPLGRWHGVDVDAQGRVVGLDLRSNGLSGTIPPELGALANLEWLSLRWNDLSGPIPLELGDLSNLRTLDLEVNGLSGEIPAELGGLSNLKVLQLFWNLHLTGPIPPELGGLSNLETLDLGENDLTGPIPPELGGLSNLWFLRLERNTLSGPIPPELGGLSNLRVLRLERNALSGPIPPELGGLSNLWILRLRDNNLTGAISPELGGLSNLRELWLERNGLSGPIPPELGGLSNLRELYIHENAFSGPVPSTFGDLASLTHLVLAHNPGLAGAVPLGLRSLELEWLLTTGTELCAPREPTVKEWLATITRRWIALCGEPPAAYLVQAVQSLTHPVPLVAGEDALLRVFVTAAMETTEGIPDVRARFYLNGTERHVADIAASSTPIPADIDEGDLSKSANAEIPGWVVRPGLEMVVEIDPGGTLDPSLGVPARIPEEGRLAVEVREMPVLDLTVIPFLWSSDPDSAIIGMAAGMAADPEGHALLEETHVLLPVRDLDVTARAPVASTSNNASDLLAQTEAIRVLEGGGGHYMGMMSGSVTGAGGVAYLSGRSNFSRPHSGTVAHELGHNMYLAHAPCGGAVGPDPSFPDPRGAIGAWGYDFRSGRLVPATRKDHMSYCDPAWTSDFHFSIALRHRLADEGTSAAAHATPTVRSLLLWGGVDTTGTPFLNPAFVADAPPALPDSAGDYTVTGRDASGRDLFSLSFAMPVALSEEAEVSSFVFALPAQAGWADALASVTLSGPAGTTTLDGDSDIPMTILRDPVTGRVRGFLRDVGDPAAEEAGALGSAVGLDLLFSRGIPDAAAWRR